MTIVQPPDGVTLCFQCAVGLSILMGTVGSCPASRRFSKAHHSQRRSIVEVLIMQMTIASASGVVSRVAARVRLASRLV